MIDEVISNALKPLVLDPGGETSRVFPDVAPEGTPTPWITYQAAGGDPSVDLDGPTTTVNTRLQVTVWADQRGIATITMDQVIAALCANPISGVPIGRPASIYESETKRYGSRLDFSIWYSP